MTTRGIYIKSLMDGVQNLNTNELDDFVNKILRLRAKRLANIASKKESDLLLNINVGLSEIELTRFNKLVTKRETETITNEEFEALVLLTEKSEKLNVQRMTALVELAQIREIALPQLMNDLNIKSKN
jgi:hypothetical protein